MDYTIFQKFTLNSLFLFIVLYLSPTCVKANVNTQQTEAENIPEIAISDINYSYELFNKSQSKFDCTGTLTCSISIPENAKELIFERTSPYQYNHNYYFFLKQNAILHRWCPIYKYRKREYSLEYIF